MKDYTKWGIRLMAIIVGGAFAMMVVGLSSPQISYRPVKYKFEMTHETDSLEFWEYSRGANRQDLYYDKKGERWFK